MIKQIIILCLSLFILSSCEKESKTSFSLTFGHFYGECIGETCIEIFKLEDGKLFEDTKDMYPSSQSFYNGNFQEVDASKYELVKDLPDFFPEALYDEINVVIGMPDAGDWGGLYVEYKDDLLHDFWILDQMKSNVPAEYHAFIDSINQRIALISD